MHDASGHAVHAHHHQGPCASNHAHAHHHGAHAASEHGSARRLGVSLGVAVLIMLGEVVGGWWSGSLALLSDAGHMLTYVAALGVAILAVLFGARPADPKRTFGFRRLEVLAAQFNVATLVGLTGWIGWEAVDRIRNPHPPVAHAVMAAAAAFGLLGNSVILVWLRGDHNLNTRSAFLHVLGDAVASLAVLVGAGAMAVWPQLAWIDPVLSLAIALLILWGAGRLVLEITDILMEAVPRHLDIVDIERVMGDADGVVAVHDLHVWTISTGLYALSAHLVVASESMGRNDDILTSVKRNVRRRFGIDHTTLQIESVDYAHVDDMHQH